MFGDEALRLLRTKWPTPTMLAEELYAILSQDGLPLEHQGPLTLSKGPGSAPGITFRGFGAGDVVFSIDRGPDLPPIQFSGGSLNLGGIPIVNVGDAPIDLGTTSLDGSYHEGSYNVVPPETMGRGGSPELVRDGADAQQAGLGQTGASGADGAGAAAVFPGKVLSGSGHNYQVAAYKHGLDLAALPVPARVLQLAAGAKVPEGTWVVLFQLDTLYYFQVPVWMDDASP